MGESGGSDHTIMPIDGGDRETLTEIEPAPPSEHPTTMLLIVMSGNDTGRIHDLDDAASATVVGRDDGVDLQLIDAEISRKHCVIRHDADEDAYFITDLESRNGTAVNGVPLNAERKLKIGDKIRLGLSTVLRLSRADEPEAKYAKQMFQVALRDGLTGAYNRRYLDERLTAEFAFAKRHTTPLSLLLIDLDHFKNINDEHGHQAGDTVLKVFFELLAAEVRTEDVVGRYGGEEFLVLCRQTVGAGAVTLAERLRQRVEATAFRYDGTNIGLTVSIGIAGIAKGIRDAKDLVKAADKALYRAKDDGRNCWRLAKPAP